PSSTSPLCLHSRPTLRVLPSFPTRRSSDLEILEPKPRLRFQRHLQHALMRPAGPEKNRIDWIRGGLHSDIAKGDVDVAGAGNIEDRKSTRLNSSHSQISYAVFCLKKKKKQH